MVPISIKYCEKLTAQFTEKYFKNSSLVNSGSSLLFVVTVLWRCLKLVPGSGNSRHLFALGHVQESVSLYSEKQTNRPQKMDFQ